MKKILLLLVVVTIIAAGWYMKLTSSFDDSLQIESPRLYMVESGSTLFSVASDLEEKEIITNAKTLIWLNRVEGEKGIFAGQYELTPEMTMRTLYAALTTGETKNDEVQVTVIEGWTIVEIAEALEKVGLVDSAEDFEAIVADASLYKEDHPVLKDVPAGASLEGYLFPDTYRFFKNATAEDIVNKLLANFDRKISEALLQDGAHPGRSIHEVITLAALVEKEVRSEEEMKVVAGIFQNRLDIGMALQADSTVNYLTRSGRARSTFDDLEIDSPYNTYKYKGLPPGPISNPGLRAIQAALDPAETDYLFFLTDLAGRVYYAATLAQHNSNRQYLDRE